MNIDMEGKKIPQAVFKTRKNGEWIDISSNEISKDKNIIIFSLPGAFTPTCSSTHVPRYEELFDVFRNEKIDDIYCIAVNDAFVMNAWKTDENVEKIKFLPDGNAVFTASMGMLVDKTDIGFGKRSWRYSMLIKNGVIEKVFSEPDKEGDPFEVSDADTMLEYINPSAKKIEHSTIFTRNFCPFCAKAKKILQEKNIPYSEIIVGKDISTAAFRAIHGKSSVPQIYIEGSHIGGSDDLVNLYK